MLKQFLKYMIPSMLASVFCGLYSVVDGIFIGQGVGDAGLAAINIAYPLGAIIQAIGTGIGMGGAVQISICRGRGDLEGERRFLGNTFALLLCSAVFFTIVLLAVSRPALILFGAEGEVLEHGLAYIQIFLGGTIFQMSACAFIPLLRNFGAAALAMGSMIAGFVTNILLDWIFVSLLGHGLPGAAWATTISQFVTVIPCLLFLRKKLRELDRSLFRPKKSTVWQIVKVGISPFGLSMSPNLVMMILNKALAVYGGDIPLAAYAVIIYVNSLIVLMLQGISDGCQPLVSFHYGKGEAHAVRKVCRWTYLFALFLSILYILAMHFLKNDISAVFGASEATSQTVAEVFPLFTIGMVFLSVCRVTTAYFYAIRNNLPAYILVYGESVFLALLLLCGFPQIWGLWGVWFAAPVSQLLLMLCSLILRTLDKKKLIRKGEAI